MANKYTLGQGVALPITFKVLTDPFGPTYAPYDPVLPTLKVEHPDLATVDTYTYPASAQILRPANPTGTGKYYATIDPTTTGTWRWKWLDPDPTKPGVLEGSFSVTAAKIT